jgi:VanZ family protein
MIEVSRELRWLIWGTAAVVWTAALLTPQPVELADAVLAPEAVFPASKSLHLAGYSLLALLTGWLRTSLPVRWGLLAFLFLHALGTEYLQQFVPGRTPGWLDAALDHLGLALGVLLSWRCWFAHAGRGVSVAKG